MLELNARPGLNIQIANRTGLAARLDAVDRADAGRLPAAGRIACTCEGKFQAWSAELPEAEARAEPPLLLRLSFRNVTMPLGGPICRAGTHTKSGWKQGSTNGSRSEQTG